MIGKVTSQLMGIMITTNARSATKYLSESLSVRISRQFPRDKRNSRETFLLTYGKPNYLGREFIKKCKEAGEPFPVRKVQLTFYPK